ncbi:hypothetical protein ACFLYQ_01220 [Chloroflexota bacterium]
MAESKYGHLFLEEPLVPSRHEGDTALVLQLGGEIAAEGWGGTPIHFVMHAIDKPISMGGDKGHTHPEAEIVFFIGPDPMNYKDFPAEAEFYIGEEMEKHVVNKTTFVYLPANVLHCPLNFTRVDRPVTFGHILFAADYEVDRRDE